MLRQLYSVWYQSGCGWNASFTDDDNRQAGLTTKLISGEHCSGQPSFKTGKDI